MTFEDFCNSIEADQEPPEGLSGELKALWLVKKNRWEESHEVVNDLSGEMGSWIHAHLHLIEGDLGNAAYWYRSANVKVRQDRSEIPEEWEQLVKANL